MRKTLALSVALLMASSAHARIVGVLATTSGEADNATLDVHGFLQGDDPLFILVLSRNPDQCRLAFSPGAAFGPGALSMVERRYRVTVSIGAPRVAAGALCGHGVVQPMDGGWGAVHSLKSLMEALGTAEPDIAKLLAEQPGILSTDRIEFAFLYQHFRAGAHDVSLNGFVIRPSQLTAKSALIHQSPR